jgi:hypothetical protein
MSILFIESINDFIWLIPMTKSKNTTCGKCGKRSVAKEQVLNLCGCELNPMHIKCLDEIRDDHDGIWFYYCPKCEEKYKHVKMQDLNGEELREATIIERKTYVMLFFMFVMVLVILFLLAIACAMLKEIYVYGEAEALSRIMSTSFSSQLRGPIRDCCAVLILISGILTLAFNVKNGTAGKLYNVNIIALAIMLGACAAIAFSSECPRYITCERDIITEGILTGFSVVSFIYMLCEFGATLLNVRKSAICAISKRRHHTKQLAN